MAIVNEESIERAAYIAANQINTSDLSFPEYACPGTRRSKRVDAMAGIIKEIMVKEMGLQMDAAGVKLDHEVVPFSQVPMGGGFSYMGGEFIKRSNSHGVLASDSSTSTTTHMRTLSPNTKVRLIK